MTRKIRKLYVDQYGQHFYAHTLRELRQQISGRANRMFVDRKDGTTLCIGYVIGSHWLHAYAPIEKEV
jgi:hypothetical protein